MRLKVEGHPDLVRDVNGAIINSNKEAFMRHTKAKQIASDRDKKIADLEQELSDLKAIVAGLVGNKK